MRATVFTVGRGIPSGRVVQGVVYPAGSAEGARLTGTEEAVMVLPGPDGQNYNLTRSFVMGLFDAVMAETVHAEAAQDLASPEFAAAAAEFMADEPELRRAAEESLARSRRRFEEWNRTGKDPGPETPARDLHPVAEAQPDGDGG